MFKVCKQTSIQVKPQQTGDKNYESVNASTQTEIVKRVDKEIQSLTTKDESVQVNLERILRGGEASFNRKKLFEFLDYASKLTIKEINESIAIESNLRYIELMNRENEELICDFHYSSKSSKSSTFDQLANTSKSKNDENSSKLTIEHVIWSSNLNQLILGFSVRQHIYWCTHDSRIEFCNLYQFSDKKPNKLKKIFEVEIKNCITQLISHPTQFTQVAVGTKAGTIQIIDRELKGSTSIGHESNLHKLEITYLSFKKSSSNQSSSSTLFYDELLSCSLDGRIVLWKIKQLEKLQPIKVFNLGKQMARQVELLGIKTACLSSEEDNLLIGCENYLFSTLINRRTSGELELDFEYEAHKGEIESIEQSLLNPNLFITNGKDGEVRLYETNCRAPLFTIHLDKNYFNYKWISSLWIDDDLSIRSSGQSKSSYFIIGLQNNNLHLINLFKKDKKYFTNSSLYALKDSFHKLFINRSNQLALVRDDEVSLFDLNVLMYLT